ncbi:MAG TPA: hypothetical protein VFN35_33805 [Ktedonobacteraceae bacterium]|nr:hypothetical protein [Ktedonobacteraceae bacterium]
MSEKEFENTLEDDLRVEVVDLDRPEADQKRRLLPRFRLTRQQRRTGTVLTALLFVIVISVLLAGTSGVGSLITHTLFPPRPSATPGSTSQEFLFYLTANPSWGQFTVDGRRMDHLPVIEQDSPLRFGPGQHEIIWKAEPFNPRVCIFIVGNASTIQSPCLLTNTVSAGGIYLQKQGATGYARVLSFFATMNDLPEGQQQELIQQIQTYLNGYNDSETVAPGEAYAVSEEIIHAHPSLCQIQVYLASCFARATEPLRATLNLQLDTSTSQNDPCVAAYICVGDNDCRQLCSSFFWSDMNQNSARWEVSAIIYISWSYATFAGKSIAHSQPPSSIRGSQMTQQVSMHITRDEQGWHVSLPLENIDTSLDANPICDRSMQDIQQVTGTMPGQGSQFMYVGGQADFPAHIAAGCLVIARPEPSSPASSLTPTPTPDASNYASFLVRFGVVLAVNDIAHRNWPFLPVANAHEQGIAQQLFANLPLSVWN